MGRGGDGPGIVDLSYSDLRSSTAGFARWSVMIEPSNVTEAGVLSRIGRFEPLPGQLVRQDERQSRGMSCRTCNGVRPPFEWRHVALDRPSGEGRPFVTDPRGWPVRTARDRRVTAGEAVAGRVGPGSATTRAATRSRRPTPALPDAPRRPGASAHALAAGACSQSGGRPVRARTNGGGDFKLARRSRSKEPADDPVARDRDPVTTPARSVSSPGDRIGSPSCLLRRRPR